MRGAVARSVLLIALVMFLAPVPLVGRRLLIQSDKVPAKAEWNKSEGGYWL